MLSTKFPIQVHNCELNSVLLMPEGPGPHPVVVLLHGFPGYQKNYDFAHSLRVAGYNAIIFSYRGSWGSEGSYALQHVLEDTAAVIAQLSNAKFAAKYRFDTERIFLIGHSLGAWNALMTTAHAPSVRATAALATFNVGYFAERLHNEAGFKEDLIRALEVLGTEPLHGTSPQQLADEIEAHYEIWDPRSFTAQLTTRPLYLVGAKHDIEAPKEPHHDAIVTSLKAEGHPHLTDEVLDTDHGFGDMREALIAKLIAWLDGVE